MIRISPTLIILGLLVLPPLSGCSDPAVDAELKGEAAQKRGDLDSAIANFTEALRLNPKNAVAYSKRGSAYEEKGEHDKAIADCTEAIQLDPKLALAYNSRGLAYLHQRDFDKATADFDEVIRLDPTLKVATENRNAAREAKQRQTATSNKNLPWILRNPPKIRTDFKFTAPQRVAPRSWWDEFPGLSESLAYVLVHSGGKMLLVILAAMAAGAVALWRRLTRSTTPTSSESPSGGKTETGAKETGHTRTGNGESDALTDGWYYDEGDRTIGPLSDEAIAEMLENGTLQEWTMVRRATGARIAASRALQFYRNTAESPTLLRSPGTSGSCETQQIAPSSPLTPLPSDAQPANAPNGLSNTSGGTSAEYTEPEIRRIIRWHRVGSFLVPIFVLVLLVDAAEFALYAGEAGPFAITLIDVLRQSLALVYVVGVCTFMVGAACVRKVGRAATIGWVTTALAPLICISLVTLGKWTVGMQEQTMSVLMAVVGITAITAWLVFPLIALRRTQRALRDYDAHMKMFGTPCRRSPGA